MSAPEITVIVPTYLEAENLPVLVPRIVQALESAAREGEIVIVDDDSPDDTESVCAELTTRFPVRLLVRRGARGLAGAVVHAMERSQGEVLAVMDADLSHPPEKLGELVAALDEEGVDFALGSRYVEGGSTEAGWGLDRLVNSKVATLLARPLTRINDPMAGFFALRRSTYSRAAALDPLGFKIALELIVKCGCRNVVEIPIHFGQRLRGESKLSYRERWDYLRHLARLYRFKLSG